MAMLTARPARADDCEEKLTFVRERLDADAHAGRVWGWSWGLGMSALALGQGGLALTRDDEGEQAELWVGAGKSVLGLVPVFFPPLPGRLAEPRPGADHCALAAEATEILEHAARDEAFGRNWLAHTLNVLVNGGGLLIVGIGYDRWGTGTLGALVGIGIGELQIFTRPDGSVRARGELHSRWTIAPMVESNATGVRLVGVF